MDELAKMFRVTEPQGLRFWLDPVNNIAECGFKSANV